MLSPLFSFALWALAFSLALASPAQAPKELKRAVPPACASPKAVSLAYQVLSAIHATEFCTKWLGITTVTVSSTSTLTFTNSATQTTTSTDTALQTDATTTVTSTTATVSAEVTAPAVTNTVSLSTTVFTPTTSTSVITSTFVSTSTFFEYNFDNSKRKRDAEERDVKPPKPSEIISIADGIVSSACSCLAKTPTATVPVTASATITSTFSATVLTTVTSVVSTSTEVDVDVITETSFNTVTPSSTITAIATLTSPTVVATTTRSTTVTSITNDFVFVDLIPVFINGCLPVSYGQKIPFTAASFAAAAEACYPSCLAAGPTVCDDYFVAQNSPPSNTFNCFLLSKAQEVNTNFVCGQAGIGQAAEIIIIAT